MDYRNEIAKDEAKGITVITLKLDNHDKVMLALRCLTLVVIIGFCFSGKPPARAQSIPPTTVEDALQDQSIGELKEFKKNQEITNQKQADAIATFQGEERGFGMGIGALQVLQILASLKKSKA